MDDDLKAKVRAEINRRAAAILAWYTTGAVDSPDTRRRINRELATMMERIVRDFKIKPIVKVLRVYMFSEGRFKIRFEDRDLS